MDVFDAIERKVNTGGSQIEVFTIGNQVKSEVKEELLIKAEKGERSKAFSQFLALISSISVEIYAHFDRIKMAVMKTYGEVQESKNLTLEAINQTLKKNFMEIEHGEVLWNNFAFDVIPNEILIHASNQE